jgi:glycosyltransferase involved in cell wall biosynthesis
MRVGLCTYWFNRGQAVVGRHLRSAIDALGHETFVLARPTRASNVWPSYIERRDVWDQPRITEASSYDMPAEEYVAWAKGNALDAVFFYNNFQLGEIAQVRAARVKTAAAFMWEAFLPEHAGPARAALDVIYCFSEADRARYASLGIDSPRVPWGCHPELDAVVPKRSADEVRLFFPGGFMTSRKPLQPVLEAFTRTSDPRLRLVIKAQVARKTRRIARIAAKDPRIEVICEDLSTARHLQLFADCHVCLAPSRWEGLGLHLYEATAFGMPVITNDNPPMNEVVEDGLNGILVDGIEDGLARSGIPAFAPDPEQLVAAIERIAADSERARLTAGALEVKRRRSWDRTIEGVDAVLTRLGA